MTTSALIAAMGIASLLFSTAHAQTCPSCTEGIYRVNDPGNSSDVAIILRQALTASRSGGDPASLIRQSVVDFLDRSLGELDTSGIVPLSYGLTDQDIRALKTLTGFPAEDDLIHYLLFRSPSVADELGVEAYFVQRLVPELNGTRVLRERSSVPYLGVGPEFSFSQVDPSEDPVPYLNVNQCANTRRINLSAVPELVLAAKAARTAEHLGESERPYALLIALEAIDRAFSSDNKELAPALQKLARETTAAVGRAAPDDSWLAEQQTSLDSKLPSLFLRARYFDSASAAFERVLENGASGPEKFLALKGLLVAVLALEKDPKLVLDTFALAIQGGGATENDIIHFSLLSRGVADVVADQGNKQMWESIVVEELSGHPWRDPSISNLEAENSFLWHMVLAGRADIAAPFLLNRLRQMRASGQLADERYYLRKLAPFVRNYFGLISFRYDGNGRLVPRGSDGYPIHLDFLHNMRNSGIRCDLTEPGEVVISDGSFVPYGLTSPEEDAATTFAAYGIISNQPPGYLLENTPQELRSEQVSEIERWATISLERDVPEASIVPYMKLLALEWFSSVFAHWEPIDPTRPTFRYLPNSASTMTSSEVVKRLSELSIVSLDQRRLFDLFLDTHNTLNELYP